MVIGQQEGVGCDFQNATGAAVDNSVLDESGNEVLRGGVLLQPHNPIAAIQSFLRRTMQGDQKVIPQRWVA